MNILKFFVSCCFLPICITAFSYTASDIKKTVLICNSCHAQTGKSAELGYPKLAGQNEKYFIKQMLAFSKKLRENPMMQTIASNLAKQDFQNLAAYYAKQPASSGIANRSAIVRGQLLYRAGDKDKHLPACMACHSPAGEGNSLAGIPMLAGQYATYTQSQLLAYRAKTRSTDKNQVMEGITSHLTDDDIKALASYIEGLHRAQ